MEKVIVIGGGPAGLSAAVYLARAGLSPLVFAGSPPGGQLVLTSEVENFPGHESILGAELVNRIRQQAERFGAKIIDQNITQIDLSASKKKVYFLESAKNFSQVSSPSEAESSNIDLRQNFVSSLSILIATGAKALWLGVPGEERFRGKGVSACATCDGFFFRDKVVAVVGGGDTAMEEALTLTKFAKLVYLIHRRNEFRASKVMQERVFNNQKIKIIWNAAVEEILGEEKVEAIKLKSVEIDQSQLKSVKGETDSNKFPSIPNNHILNVDGLFVAIGHKPDTAIFKDQIAIDEKGYIITTDRLAYELLKLQITNYKSQITNYKLQTDSKRKTNSKQFENLKIDYWKLFKSWNLELGLYRSSTSVPGVFAAGDCVDFQYRQAATAAGMGVVAALEIERWLEKSSKY